MTMRVFQSTLPVWGATHRASLVGVHDAISIHAPRVGSDSSWATQSPCRADFNPRSPCGERPPRRTRPSSRRADFNPRSPCGERHTGDKPLPDALKFQSTLPVWGATWRLYVWPRACWHFNPRSPCGERHRSRSRLVEIRNFNPRSPCGERRTETMAHVIAQEFQSTLPVWGAT